MSQTDIPLIGEDEIFVRLMDCKHFWLSNYDWGITIDTRTGKYKLFKGNSSGSDFSYTVRKCICENGIWKDVRKTILRIMNDLHYKPADWAEKSMKPTVCGA